MNTKAYIVILLSIVFFGKFLMLDAKMFNSILEAHDITFVNPFCKEQSENGVEKQTLSANSKILTVSTDALCNKPFYVLISDWIKVEKKPTFHDYGHINPFVIPTYFAKNYPPPKVLVI